MTQVGELLRLPSLLRLTGQCSYLISARLVGMELVLCQYQYFYDIPYRKLIELT